MVPCLDSFTDRFKWRLPSLPSFKRWIVGSDKNTSWMLVRDLVARQRSGVESFDTRSLPDGIFGSYGSCSLHRHLVPPQVRYDMAPTPNTDLRFATTGGLGVSFLRSRFVRPGATFVDVDSCFIDPPPVELHILFKGVDLLIKSLH